MIKSADVMIERRPKTEFAAIVDRRTGLGLAAQARARAGPGHPRQADLAKPELVARNETVTIYYEVPGIVLTIRGKALDARRAGRHHQRAQRAIQAHDPGDGQPDPAA